MRIGLIVDHLSVESGTGIARYSLEVLNGLRDEGVEVEVISLKPFGVPFGEAFNHTVRLPYCILKKAGNFDLIHASAPITGLGFPFLKKPKVMTYHDIISLLHKGHGAAFHVRVSAPFFSRIGKYADRIIAVSTQTKEELMTQFGFPGEKIVVINPGIDEGFRPLKKEKKDHYTIGYVGALAPRKRVDYLIRAVHLLKKEYPKLKIKLLICGKGNEFHRLENVVDRLKLRDSVEFKGFVLNEKLVETYNSFDVFVLPSEWEGFGLPVLEAQKCGVPVIVREDARIPQEVTKHCVRAESEEDMAKKIYELLTNTSFKKHVVKKGLEYSKRFTWEKTIKKTLKIYEEVTKNH